MGAAHEHGSLRAASPFGVVWLVIFTVACTSARSDVTGGQGGAPPGNPSNALDGATTPANGWVDVTGEFPNLARRARAVVCPEIIPGECTRDADCGAGKACACGGPDGFGLVNRCIPAECREDAECESGLCLLSLGSRPGDCCTFGNLGLFCQRVTSTCPGADYCIGNGNACLYAAQRDRFECQPYPCLCP